MIVPHTVTVASVASVRALYVKHYKMEGGGEGRTEAMYRRELIEVERRKGKREAESEVRKSTSTWLSGSANDIRLENKRV